jgi:hypothetical protein
MPTALRVNNFRFFFYSNEGVEPPHVHVEFGGDGYAKYWLTPIVLDRSRGLDNPRLGEIRDLIEQHHQLLLNAWNDHLAQ